MPPSRNAAEKSSPPPTKRTSKTPATPPRLEKKPGVISVKGKEKSTVAAAPPPPVLSKAVRPKKRNLGKTPREIRKKVLEVNRRLAIRKALKTQKKVIALSDSDRKRVRKARTTVQFRRPRTFRPPRNPKFPRKAIPKRRRMDMFNVLEYPLTTEAAMRKIEDQNTLVFIVHKKATKPIIRSAVKKILEVDVVKVNTLVCPSGKKKAFVKLAPDFDALDQANKIGII